MFQKGEKVVYGQTGVCVVEDITEKELIRNQKKLYYVLKPVFQNNNIIYAPADSNKIFIRPIITAEQATELIAKIPEIKEKSLQRGNTTEDYRAELSSHECTDLIELTSRIYEKKKLAQSQKKKLGFSDERYMRLAESLLFGELAVALDIPVEDVPGFIEESIKEKG